MTPIFNHTKDSTINGHLKSIFSLCHVKQKEWATEHCEKSTFFICQVSFHSRLYALAMKFSKYTSGDILWKNIFFLYDGENIPTLQSMTFDVILQL